MEYILSSIGRCGGNLLFRLVKEATGRRGVFAASYDVLNKADGRVKKTHLHFKEEFEHDYRAVFIYGEIACVIASLYKIYGDSNFEKRWNERTGVIFRGKISSHFWKIWLRQHFFHLGINSRYIKIFFLIARYSKMLAFLFLIVGDKFNFKSNIESWKHSKKTFFVKYENLCTKKEEMLKQISDWLGVALPSFELKKRASGQSELPFILRMAINMTYDFR